MTDKKVQHRDTRVKFSQGWVPEGAFCTRRFRPNRCVQHAGRHFEIIEFCRLSLNSARLSPMRYEVREWAVFDHWPHCRHRGEFGSQAKAEAWIAKLGNLDREREAEAARPKRIEWLEEQHRKCAARRDEARKLARRSTMLRRDRDGVKHTVPATPEVKKQRAEKFEKLKQEAAVWRKRLTAAKRL